MCSMNQFIREIRIHPVLWDNQMKEYNDRSKVDKNWNDVCSNLMVSSK